MYDNNGCFAASTALVTCPQENYLHITKVPD